MCAMHFAHIYLHHPDYSPNPFLFPYLTSILMPSVLVCLNNIQSLAFVAHITLLVQGIHWSMVSLPGSIPLEKTDKLTLLPRRHVTCECDI